MSPVEAFKQAGTKSLGVAYQYYAMLLVIFTVLYGIVTPAVGAVHVQHLRPGGFDGPARRQGYYPPSWQNSAPL